MPTASSKKSAPSATVHETVIRKEVREPVEVPASIAPEPIAEPREDFWKYIEGLTPEDWKVHHCSLYRYPLGQVKPQKLGRYVRTYKFDSPLLSEDQVFEEFGGGQYDAMLRGPHVDGSGRTCMIARYSWEMEGPAKAPWISSTSPAGAPAAPPSELVPTLQVVLDKLERAQSTGRGESPAIKESISLIQQLTSALPKPQGIGELVQGLASLKDLTGGDREGLKETLSLLKEMGIIGAERREAKSLAQELKDIMEIAGMMGGGGGKTDWASSLVTNLPSILEKVTPIADRFAEVATSNARIAELRAGRAPAAAAPGAPAALPTRTDSPAPRVVAPPQTEPASASAAAPSPSGAPVPPNLEWVKARAVQLFAAGKTGDEVADWCDKLDPQLGDFLGSMDREKFTAFVREDPILRAIATAPRFPEFVEEFVDYFSTSEGEETPAERELTR